MTTTSFVQSSETKVNNGTKLTYYYCNRSGFFKTESKEKRALKTQGSAQQEEGLAR